MANKGLKIEKLEAGKWEPISLEEVHRLISEKYAKGYKNVEQWIYRALEAGAVILGLRAVDYRERNKQYIAEHGKNEFFLMLFGLWLWLNRIHRNDDIEAKGH